MSFPGIRRAWLAGASLALLTVGVFLPLGRHGFIGLDDSAYLYENPWVRQGLTGRTVVWAFTSLGINANWHPLTWLSHLLDVSLFGMDAGKMHLMSLGFHLAATLLLFLLLRGMTGALGPSAFTAALFAVHPLHVESVAWASERKDVLSACLLMLTLLAWLGYLRRPGAGRYLGVALLYALGLMAKPMLVTMPLLLLLLDRWPLGRWPLPGRTTTRTSSFLFLEKSPLATLAAASAVITLLAQRVGGGLKGWESYPLETRLLNVPFAAAGYLGRTIWPLNLGILYPHPGRDLAMSWGLAALALLAGISIAAIRLGRRHPYLSAGWFWYLTALLPVVGLVQVGSQGSADRYTYLPLIGIFLMAAWGIPELLPAHLGRWRIPAAAGSVALLVLALLARRQVGYWRDSVTLFTRTLEVTRGNPVIHNNLGTILGDRGDLAGAESHLRQAVALQTDYAMAQYNLGNILYARERLEAAVVHYREALRLDPLYYQAWKNLGNTYLRLGDYATAADAYRACLARWPGDQGAQNNLGVALVDLGRPREARESFLRAIVMDPRDPQARYNLGLAYELDGKPAEAVTHYRQALMLKPDHAKARDALEHVLRELGAGP